jgi:hypothetical protein
MLRRFKQRAAEEFGPLAPRARPALITTEILQPAVSDHLKLNEEPDELAEEPHSSNCPEYRVAWYLLRDIAPHLIGIHSFADPGLMECGSRCVIRQRTVEIRAVLNNFIDEQRREESLVAESPQEQSVVSEEPHTNLSGETDLLVSRFSKMSSMTLNSCAGVFKRTSTTSSLLVNAVVLAKAVLSQLTCFITEPSRPYKSATPNVMDLRAHIKLRGRSLTTQNPSSV